MKPEGLNSDSSDFSLRWHALAAGVITALLLVLYFTLKGLVLH